MNELLWGSQWPSQFSLLAAAALMLICGALAVRVLSSTLRLPEVTAFILCGLFLGPSGVGLVSAETVSGLSILADVALGLILFDLGRHVDPVWLLRERWALITALTQTLAVFVGVSLLLVNLGTEPLLAAMMASLVCAGSPVISFWVAQESKAEGQVTNRMLHAVALQCIFAVGIFALCFQVLHVSQAADWKTALGHPIYLTAGSIVLGLVMSRIALFLSNLLQPRMALQQLVVIGFIVILVEANDLLRLSPLISLLVFGIGSRGYGKNAALQPASSGVSRQLVFAFFLVYLGSTLVVDFRLELLLLGVGIVLARWILLLLPSVALSRLNGLSYKKGVLLGTALVPLSGVSIVLVGHTTSFYPEFGVALDGMLATAVFVSSLVGPLLTWWSLRWAGEGRSDA